MTASIPPWVFAILLALLSLGYRQSLPRIVRPGSVVTVAMALGVFSIYGVVTAFGATAMPLVMWLAGFAASVLPGRGLFAPRGLAREGTAVRVAGSWLPMVLMLGIFSARFVLGFANGTGAPFVHEAWFIAATSATLGLFSGGFAARAIAVHRFAFAVQAS